MSTLNPDKFPTGTRVVRVPCPADCQGGDCPDHVKPGEFGTIIRYAPERMMWHHGGRATKQYAWRVEWDDHGGWWTMDHCMESEDSASPGFPDAVWTEG